MKIYRIDGRKPKLQFELDVLDYSWVQINVIGETFYGENGLADGTGYLRKIDNNREYVVYTVAGTAPVVINRFFFDTSGNIFCAGYNKIGSGGGFIGKINTNTGAVAVIAGSLAADVGDVDSNDGTQARFGNLYDAYMDASGTFYINDADNGKIRRVQRNGRTRTLFSFAGVGMSMAYYYGIVADKTGIVYVAVNEAIHKIDPNGNRTILAGTVGSSGYVDGSGATARFDFGTSGTPYMAIDPSGTIIYVMDSNGIRRISESGRVSTIAPPSTNDNTADVFSGNIIVDNKGIPYVCYPDSFIP